MLGQDDFGASCDEDLSKLEAAMTKAAEGEDATAEDVWATARQGLCIAAAYVADRSEDDQVALWRTHALLHAAFTLRLQDRPVETLTMHPKYSDQAWCCLTVSWFPWKALTWNWVCHVWFSFMSSLLLYCEAAAVFCWLGLLLDFMCLMANLFR